MDRNIQNREVHHFSSSLPSEMKEGGLNIKEAKNTLLRNLPLIVGCTLTFSCLGFLKVIKTPPVYISSFELLSEPLNIETQVTSTDEESRETREQITSVDLDQVQLKILKSPKLILRVVESLQDKYPTINYQNLINNLNIEIIADKNNQNILLVVYKDYNKQIVSDVTNTLSQVYLDYSIEKRQSGIKRGIAFLDTQIPRINSQAEGIEEKIQELRSKHNFIKPDVPIDSINNRLNSLIQQEKEVVDELQELKLKANNFEQETQNSSLNSTTAIDFADSQYLELINKLQAIDVEIAQKSPIFSEKSIELQTLNQEKAEIYALIAKEELVIRQKIDNQIKTLENRQQTITSEIQNLKNQLEKWSQVTSEYSSLQQKLASNNSKLSDFILQKDALSIDAAQQETPWQILTPVSEPKTNKVSAINYLLLSSVLGLLVGVGIAFIIDLAQMIIYTPKKVEEITNLPILGTIPHNNKDKKLLSARQIDNHNIEVVRPIRSFSNLDFSSTEAFHSFAANLGIFDFHTNLNNFDLQSNLKSLIITSAIAKEGKSTVAINLAKASAFMGKRVLLVDTDFRSQNSLTNSLGMRSEKGLWNLLNKDNSCWDLHSLKQLSLEENLFILPSGYNDTFSKSTKSDPSRLLASPKMYLLMEELKNYYDLIIYDLCAILGFADVNLLANKADGIVVVVSLGKIQTVTLTEALSRLTLCKASILGVAINEGVGSAA